MTSKRKAYTIVEMLVVVAIMIIMASIFVTSSEPRKKMDLQRDAYFFVQNIRQAQELSMAVQGFEKCASGVTPKGGYGIFLEQAETDSKDKKYTLYGDCDETWLKGANSGTLYDAQNGVTRLSPGIRFKDITAKNKAGGNIYCEKFWAQYYPPDPQTFLWCDPKEGSSCDNNAQACTSSQAELIFYQTSGEQRKIYLNEAGLVYTEAEKK